MKLPDPNAAAAPDLRGCRTGLCGGPPFSLCGILIDESHNPLQNRGKGQRGETVNLSKTRSIELPLSMDSFESANVFIEQWLAQNRFSREAIIETKLLFEALFRDFIEQGFDENTTLTIKAQRTFGEYNIKFGFEGKSYVPVEKNLDGISPELRIVQAYHDKIGYRYRSGYNSIRVVVKRNYRSSLLYCLIGIVLAILVYLMIRAAASAEQMSEIDGSYIMPLMNQFANAMLMVGAPVTFFSLVKNLTDIYIVSEKSSSDRKLQIKTIVTSVIAILLAVGTSFLIELLLSHRQGYMEGEDAFGGGMSVTQFISSLLPSSIFEPFETYLPFPIIIVALLTTYAFCSLGEYFDVMQKAVNVCLTFFSKMLNVVMFTLPFFCFLAILSSLLVDGFMNLLVVAESIGVVFLSLIVMAGFYLIRLLIGGVRVVPFIRKFPVLLWENYKINSAIDALPFNIRYCSREYGFDRKRLSAKLPILAQTNQDGNCFLIMLISMLFIYLLGIRVSLLQLIGIAVLVLFLSIGAPNQPGSILIGMLIITFYLQADELVLVAIYAEVFFGALQNAINVVGDIVTVAIEEQKSMRASA